MNSRTNLSILYCTRSVRLFCYGFLSIILALFLAQIGLDAGQIGLLFTLTLAGDALISLWLTTSADRFGRKRILLIGGLLMAGAGIVFLQTNNPTLLMTAAILGVISPSGNEIGPFLSVEQAAFTQLLPDKLRTRAFAWILFFPPRSRCVQPSTRHPSGACLDCIDPARRFFNSPPCLPWMPSRAGSSCRVCSPTGSTLDLGLGRV